MIHTRIFLTGFMGTGKSTLGPRLARRIDYRFEDLDEVIARRAGTSIPEIFAREGEEGFRRREREAVAWACEQTGVVVALGGGAVADVWSRDRILASGLLVRLTVSVDRLVARLARSRGRRPLLQDDFGETLRGPRLRARIDSLLSEREPAYAAAHVTVNVEASSHGQAVDRLLQAISETPPPSPDA